MTPVAGTDCFVTFVCNEVGNGCSVSGSSPGVANRDQYPIQIFIDANDYVWAAIIQYAQGPLSDHVPYWVQLYKSIEPLDCDAVKAAGNDGYTPVGPGSTEWMVFVCEGRHAEWEDSDCTDNSGPPLMNDPFVGITFFHSRYGCCLTFQDPCNPISEGACDGAGGDNCEHCSNCDDGIAPQLMLFEIDRNYGPLAYADGTFVLSLEPSPCEAPSHECSWSNCFPVNDPGATAIRSIRIRVYLEDTGGFGFLLRWQVNFYGPGDDCDVADCIFLETHTGEDAGTNCPAIDHEYDPPTGYYFGGCAGGASPIPTWSPYVRVRAI